MCVEGRESKCKQEVATTQYAEKATLFNPMQVETESSYLEMNQNGVVEADQT